MVREFPIAAGVVYAVHPDHRNRTPNKSQWTVPVDSEVDCFRLSHQNEWILEHDGWGLHVVNGRADYLGITADRVRQLFIARFTDGNATRRWHGYPADPAKRSRDMVPEEIAQDWLTRGLLRPAVVSKLLRNKPCRL